MKKISFQKAPSSLAALILCAGVLLTSCGNVLVVQEETTESKTAETEEIVTRQNNTEEEKITTEEITTEEVMENPDWINGKLRFTLIGGTKGDNDGAAWGGYLFKFNGRGTCYVYDLNKFSKKAGQVWKTTGDHNSLAAYFTLDRADVLAPHSNAVFFGTEKFSPEDEFPLLYCNVYNNLKEAADRREGTLLAYRITRSGSGFSSQLVQLIQVGFTKDTLLWSSETGDVRPYGNFTLDRDTNTLYAFTMRDEDQSTRYFSFAMPSVKEGVADEELGVKKLNLQKEDILTEFSCDWHHYIQGAEVSDGLIWSVEGRTESSSHPAALRIIDPEKKKEVRFVRLADYVSDIEPEVITFWDGKCYYGDVKGNIYLVECVK